MYKNVASQKIAVYAFDATTMLSKTGDAANITVYYNGDWGGVTALTDTSATELNSTNAKGWYTFDLSQAETNFNTILFTGKSSTANIEIVGQLIYTDPPNYTALSINASSGGAAITSEVKTNQAVTLVFPMTDDTDHNLAAGLTVSAQISKDAAALTATANSVTAISNGLYTIDLTAAETNAGVVTLLLTATGADPLVLSYMTQP